MDNKRASSGLPKLWTLRERSGRGAFRRRRRCAARHVGVSGKANVGMSNDNSGEKPGHRKTKVSLAMLISRGLVGS